VIPLKSATEMLEEGKKESNKALDAQQGSAIIGNPGNGS
jgi:hypothetical protein